MVFKLVNGKKVEKSQADVERVLLRESQNDSFSLTRAAIAEKINIHAKSLITIATLDGSVDGERLARVVEKVREGLLVELNILKGADLKSFDYITPWDDATDFIKPVGTLAGWWSSIMSKLFG